MNFWEMLHKLWTGYPISEEFINKDYPQFFQSIGGLQLTILITIFSILLSLIPAALLGFMQTKSRQLFRQPIWLSGIKILNSLVSKGIVEIIRGIPLVILIMLVFSLPYPLFGLRIPIAIRGLIAMTIYSSVYMSTIFQSGFKAVTDEWLDTAKVIGMNRWQILTKIQIPIAFRVMLPTFLGLVITVFKDTSILTVVGVGELTFTARQMTTAQPIDYFLILFMVLVIYWSVATLGSALVKLLEKKLAFKI